MFEKVTALFKLVKAFPVPTVVVLGVLAGIVLSIFAAIKHLGEIEYRIKEQENQLVQLEKTREIDNKVVSNVQQRIDSLRQNQTSTIQKYLADFERKHVVADGKGNSDAPDSGSDDVRLQHLYDGMRNVYCQAAGSKPSCTP